MPFWYTVKFAVGTYRSNVCPVLILCTCELDRNWSLFLVTNCHDVRIFKILFRVGHKTSCSYYYYYYYCYSALGPVWAETRAQSGDWYGSGTLHPGQVLRGSLLLLSPVFRCSHVSPPGASMSATT